MSEGEGESFEFSEDTVFKHEEVTQPPMPQAGVMSPDDDLADKIKRGLVVSKVIDAINKPDLKLETVEAGTLMSKNDFFAYKEKLKQCKPRFHFDKQGLKTGIEKTWYRETEKPESELESLRKRTKKTGDAKQSRKKRKKDSLIANVKNTSADQMEARDWTDYDTAKFFVEKWGDDMCYLRGSECLYVYFNDRWHYDKSWDLLKGLYTQNMIGYLAEAIKRYNDAGNTVALDIATEKLKSCQTSRDINAVAAQIKIILSQRMDSVEFDTGKEQYFNLQYKNGVFDLRLKKLRPRLKTDYVTLILDYDYMEADEISAEVHVEVESFYRKTQPSKEQRDFQLGFLALCLTGDTTQQKGKINIGYKASNGKSTELKIHDKVFPIYTTKLDKRTFNEKYEKQHKQLLELIEKPIRLAYIEEMDRNKVDAELLKDFIDGYKLNIEILYKTKDVKLHQSKLMTCSNKDPNICPDPGVMRRLPCQHYNSTFVPISVELHEAATLLQARYRGLTVRRKLLLIPVEQHEAATLLQARWRGLSVRQKLKSRSNDSVHEKTTISAASTKHVDWFPLVRGFENKFERPEHANAYLHLLLPYLDKLKIPASAWKDFEDIATDNDDFRDHLEKLCKITGNPHDTVPKSQIEAHFKHSTSYSHAKWSTILAELKRLGLTYVRDERSQYNVIELNLHYGEQTKTIKCRGCVHGLVVRDDQ